MRSRYIDTLKHLGVYRPSISVAQAASTVFIDPQRCLRKSLVVASFGGTQADPRNTTIYYYILRYYILLYIVIILQL